MPVLEEMSRDELIALVGEQAGRIACQDGQITAMAARIAELVEVKEALAGRLARVEHLLSRNSKNSSSPPSRDDDPGRTPPPETGRGGGPKRSRGKQRGAAGSSLAWTETPDERIDRFPEGRCECGDELGCGFDPGIADRYQRHEIPLVSVKITQYDQHAVRCRCGKVHTASRPEGATGSAAVEYGPNLAAFAVYVMVVHFVPTHRAAALLEALTGAGPSVGFVHGLLSRTARALGEVHQRIRTLITGAHAVSCDETPLKAGRAHPHPGRRKPRSTCWSPPPSSTPTTCSATGPWTPSPRSSCPS